MLSVAALFSFGCIVAVWGLYPLTLLALAAARRAAPAPTPSPLPTVTVVVATRADAELMDRRVDDLLEADYPAELLDVVVAYDARMTEARIDLSARDASRVTLVSGDEPGGKAAALNAGVRAARGEVLVFADAGQRFGADTIRKLVTAAMPANVGATTGRLVLATGESAPSPVVRAYWALECVIRRAEAALHSSIGVTGAVYAMRRARWTPLPAGLILDDVYVPMRLVLEGYRVTYVDEARAYETRPATASNEYRRKVRTLTGVWQLCAWLPRVVVPVRNPVWTQFVVHKLLRLLTPYWALLCAVWVAVAIGERIGIVAFALVVVLCALALQLRVRPIAKVRRLLHTSLLLQLATMTATANGARKRWDVWQS